MKIVIYRGDGKIEVDDAQGCAIESGGVLQVRRSSSEAYYSPRFFDWVEVRHEKQDQAELSTTMGVTVGQHLGG